MNENPLTDPSYIASNPSVLIRYLNHRIIQTNGWLQSRFGSRTGVDVTEEDWDNLIILDGCRYDLFESFNTIEGTLKAVESRGSESWEFLRENFGGKQLHDTIYITANPHAAKLEDDLFFKKQNLLDTHWDQKYKTVLPAAVVSETKKILEEYDHKRFIVHFMQPHYPFIGSLGQELSHSGLVSEEHTEVEHQIWTQLEYGLADCTVEEVWNAYKENFEQVLPHVNELLSELSGKTVVTSDHGNLFGERIGPIPSKGYGHPRGIRAENLVTVPWLEINASDRPEIKSATPESRTEMDEATVQDRLAHLGYK